MHNRGMCQVAGLIVLSSLMTLRGVIARGFAILSSGLLCAQARDNIIYVIAPFSIQRARRAVRRIVKVQWLLARAEACVIGGTSVKNWPYHPQEYLILYPLSLSNTRFYFTLMPLGSRLYCGTPSA